LPLSTQESNITDSIINSGENALPASLQRFVRLNNNKEVFYDTMTPDPRLLWQKQTGIKTFLSSSGVTVLSFGLSGSNTQDPALIDILASANGEWFKSHVYNNSLGRVNLSAQVNNLSNTALFFNDGVEHPAANNQGHDQFVKTFDEFNFLPSPESSISGLVGAGAEDDKKQTQNLLMWLYGFGTGPTGSLQGTFIDSENSYTVTQRPRGYKYGVMSVTELHRSNIFRYDKFGQLADMLEQSIDAMTYNKFSSDANESPVKINFVVKENDDTFKILSKDAILANTVNSSTCIFVFTFL
jgi:hypothetical protein